MKRLAKDWLESAEMDLANIAKIIDDEFLAPIVCFHSQQCIEKSFKAYLESVDKKIPKTHDVIRLYGAIKSVFDIEMNLELLQTVNDLYIETRYPSELGLLPNGRPSCKDVREFYQFARDIFNDIEKELEKLFTK